jgi:hypothetical protein
VQSSAKYSDTEQFLSGREKGESASAGRGDRGQVWDSLASIDDLSLVEPFLTLLSSRGTQPSRPTAYRALLYRRWPDDGLGRPLSLPTLAFDVGLAPERAWSARLCLGESELGPLRRRGRRRSREEEGRVVAEQEGVQETDQVRVGRRRELILPT